MPETSSESFVAVEGRHPTTLESKQEENLARENLYSVQATAPIKPSTLSSGSGKCDSPSDYDSAGNHCGERAASKRPNLSSGNPNPTYTYTHPPVSSASSDYSYTPPVSSGGTYVRGYFRKNGTYVRGHSRRSRR
jgi:hypothetical protein